MISSPMRNCALAHCKWLECGRDDEAQKLLGTSNYIEFHVQEHRERGGLQPS